MPELRENPTNNNPNQLYVFTVTIEEIDFGLHTYQIVEREKEHARAIAFAFALAADEVAKRVANKKDAAWGVCRLKNLARGESTVYLMSADE